jgi:hypothetical protein
VYEVRHRVLRERLEQTVAAARWEPDDECVRLGAAVSGAARPAHGRQQWPVPVLPDAA